MRNQNNTNQVVSQAWTVAPWIVEPVLVERKRSSDGKWLKRNVKFAKAPKAQSAVNVETASKYGCEAEDLFL